MKTVKIKIHCAVCEKFKIEHEVSVNKYGYFAIPDAYCPECFCLLEQVIDGERNGRRNPTD